jgi:cation diffusion facilitator CzcD-associated flavoprotein CzcO
MTFKALRVAVIGAGVSGLTSAKHLKAVGIEVVVFERSSTSGGIWCVLLTNISNTRTK